MGPANQNSLAQRRNIDWITAGGVTGIVIEIVAAVEDVASHQTITAQLIINPVGEIETMEWRLQDARNAAKLNGICASSKLQ